MIKDAIVNEKVGNLNISSLSIDRQKNIVEVANKQQISGALVLLL